MANSIARRFPAQQRAYPEPRPVDGPDPQPQWLPSDRSIDVLVGRLRRKLRDDPAEPQLIITIHGAGYLFTAAASDA